MKKTILTIIAFLTFLFVNAQVKIKPGIKAGLNLSYVTNNFNTISRNNNSSNLTSFHIGATLSFRFSNIYTLQPEVLYSKQGSKINNFFGDFELKADYLSFIVNNKFYIGGGKFNLQIAPVLDILVNDNSPSNNFQGADFGIVGGLGYDFPFGMTVDVRYKQGLVDIFGQNIDNGSGVQTTDIGDLILNQVFMLSLGYQFDF